MQYKRLFAPLTIRSLTLPNRMIVSAMVTNYANQDGTPTEKMIAYYEEKAKGGWGAIITEDYKITEDGGGFRNLPGLFSDSLIAPHRELTRRVHTAGGNIIAQIYHAGRETFSSVTGTQIVGPSAIREPSISEIPRELTVEEIQTLVTQFADCAQRAKEAGFDGVEIHGAHGYLVGAFVSPFSNKRTDAYGGSTLRRSKFATDIVKAIRERVGDDYPIFYRMSCVEYVDGGLDIEEAKVIARLMQEAGVDCLHCSQGVYSSPTVIIPPAKAEKGKYVNNAAALKSVVTIPVITVGRITDPEMADTILLSGKADLVTMARASLADPHLPQKAKEGREDEIIRCIGCREGCAQRSSAGLPVLCMVNPRTGMEDIYKEEETLQPKTVLVIGGGVSGAMAAIAAARRGHRVILCEKSDRLGGQWLAASIPPGKTDFSALLVWQEGELNRLQVDLRFNTEADEAVVESIKPDVLIDATGSVPFIPPVKGIDHPNALLAVDVLMGRVRCGHNVIVIGGGMVGVETAEFVAQGGSKVDIIEMTADIAKDAERETRMMLVDHLNRLKVHTHPSTKVTEIAERTVIADNAGQRISFHDVDTIILAAGNQPNPGIQQIRQKYDVISIGDARSSKDGFENIHEAYRVGNSL